MKRRVAHWLARLYPAAWRERYGEEFEALVEDSRPGWRGLFDIAKGAAAMRLQSPPSLMRAAFWFGLMGLLAAIPTAVMWHDRFFSVAALRAPYNPEAIAQLQQTVLRRTTLTELIQRHNLYPDRSDRLEEFQRNIRVTGLTQLRKPGNAAFRVGFKYDDPETAQAVTRELMTLMIDESLKPGFSAGSGIEVLDMPSLPQQPVEPNRPVLFFVFGLGGALLGALVAMVRRDGPLRVIRFAAVGAAIGVTVVLLGAVFRRQVSPPTVMVMVEPRDKVIAEIWRPLPTSQLLEQIAARHHFSSVDQLRSHLSFTAYPGASGRARIIASHPDQSVALAVLQDLLAGMPNVNPVTSPAPLKAPIYDGRSADLSLGAILGMVMALAGAAFRRPRVIQPAT